MLCKNIPQLQHLCFIAISVAFFSWFFFGVNLDLSFRSWNFSSQVRIEWDVCRPQDAETSITSAVWMKPGVQSTECGDIHHIGGLDQTRDSVHRMRRHPSYRWFGWNQECSPQDAETSITSAVWMKPRMQSVDVGISMTSAAWLWQQRMRTTGCGDSDHLDNQEHT